MTAITIDLTDTSFYYLEKKKKEDKNIYGFTDTYTSKYYGFISLSTPLLTRIVFF